MKYLRAPKPKAILLVAALAVAGMATTPVHAEISSCPEDPVSVGNSGRWGRWCTLTYTGGSVDVMASAGVSPGGSGWGPFFPVPRLPEIGSYVHLGYMTKAKNGTDHYVHLASCSARPACRVEATPTDLPVGTQLLCGLNTVGLVPVAYACVSRGE